jgi:hypothetical protein
MSKWSIKAFNLHSDFKIAVTFADGTSGIVDLFPRLSRGPLGDAFDPLCDQSIFSKVHLDYGALTWRGKVLFFGLRYSPAMAFRFNISSRETPHQQGTHCSVRQRQIEC